MKKVFCIFAIGVLFLLNNVEVNATSGFLKKDSIVTCNGITYGSHGDGHWHVAVKNEDGRYNASGNPITSNPCSNNSNNSNSNNSNNSNNNNTNTTTTNNNNNSNNKPNNNNNSNNNTVIKKSDDNSLKVLKVNNDFIDISDDMNYTTMEETANIEAVANHTKATIEYDNNVNLEIGNNLVSIVVKADNGNKKEYKLNILREKVLSDNKNIKIKVDDEEIKFTLYKSEKIYASYNDEKINITYELEDENAKVEISGNENLKVGENEITLKVIAENGDEQVYKIIVEKSTKIEDTIYTIIALLFMGGSFFGIGYLVYYFAVKKKKN